MQDKAVKTSDSHPIFVDFLPFAWGDQKAQLAITFAPGKKQPNGWAGHWDRDLTKDLLRIKEEFKISTLVSLLENHQFKKLKIQNELEECQRLGIQPYNLPIVDNSIPSDELQFKRVVIEIVEKHLKKGKNVVVHCMGGLGRAPTFAASCLIYSGVKASDAIEIVRKARANSLTTASQINFLKNLVF